MLQTMKRKATTQGGVPKKRKIDVQVDLIDADRSFTVNVERWYESRNETHRETNRTMQQFVIHISHVCKQDGTRA